MSRVVCRRGVARGAVSEVFYVDDLLRALHGNTAQYVYAELDGAGRVTAAGGAARVAACARLAPSSPERGADLALAPASASLSAGGALVLRAATALAPHQELLLWFAEDALAALDMPVLTPRNIRGRGHYACHRCGAGFHEPNALKLHLFLRCEPFAHERFWTEAAARLRAAPGPAPPGPALRPADLEALAAEWGRSRAGHRCLYCGKLYSRRYGLKIHLRTHTGYRPLRCRYCLRAFGDPSNLNKHVRLHAARAGGAAPHACALCGRALARRRDLERHLRAHALDRLPAASPGHK